MEVIKHYQGLDEIIESMAKIANNLEEMTRIRKMYEGSNPLDCDQEIQDLKLENDRLAKRDDKMRQVIRAIACDPACEFCLLRESECSARDMQLLAMQTLKELEEL